VDIKVEICDPGRDPSRSRGGRMPVRSEPGSCPVR